MRVQFHTDSLKSVMLFVHRLTATERASIELNLHPVRGHSSGAMEVKPEDSAIATVFLTLVRTSVEDLKRFMASVPGGEAMAESVQEVTEMVSTRLTGERTGFTITVGNAKPELLLYDGKAETGLGIDRADKVPLKPPFPQLRGVKENKT